MVASAPPQFGTVYAVLLNHRDAVAAVGDAAHAAPYGKPPVAPVLYLRPANTWSATGATVVLPDDVDAVDVEATVGIVFACATSHVAVADALDHVRGVVVVADLTAPHTSFYRPAIRQRNRDGFCVFGAMVDLPDLAALQVTTTVDDGGGTVASTADLVRDVPRLIADCSAFMRFDADDVLLIGALGRPVRARRGDAVRVAVDGLDAVAFTLATVPSVVAAPVVRPVVSTPRRRSSAPKTGRIAWQGAIHEVTEADGRIRLADGRLLDDDEPVWLPPLAPTARPRSLYALGLNYADHAKELAFRAPDEPLIFMKGASTLLGHRGTTLRPADATYMHYECELAVVVGRTARGVQRADAYDFVAGYTVANDYAIRDYLENWYRPNLRVKNREGTTPVGPWLVDAQAIDDPMALALTTRVDGVVTQQGSTRDMIFDVPFLVEYLSSFATLFPGDVILTGTPEGLVDTPAGAVVETTIEGIGTLINTIAADPRSPRASR